MTEEDMNAVIDLLRMMSEDESYSEDSDRAGEELCKALEILYTKYSGNINIGTGNPDFERYIRALASIRSLAQAYRADQMMAMGVSPDNYEQFQEGMKNWP